MVRLVSIFAAFAWSETTSALKQGNSWWLSDGKCENNDDCSLLGECIAGACACYEGWTGPDCARADLEPFEDGSGYFNESFASWGGRSLLAEDGSWHLFATQIEFGCPLILFQNNSYVIRAVSKTGPAGCFSHRDTIVPTFAHNPSVIGPTPDGHYLMFYIGEETTPDTVINCARDGVPTSGCSIPPFTCRPRGNSVVNLAWSKSIEGPWERKVLLKRNHDGNLSRWDCSNNNPTGVILPNGSIVVVYRANRCVGNNGENLGVAFADHWSDEFVRAEDPILRHDAGFGNNEDPDMWMDQNGHFHMIVHQQSKGNVCGDSTAGHTCGAHLFSRDARQWTVSQTPTYNSTVVLANGSIGELRTRQRPQIVFNKDGTTPLVLYNAASFEGNNPDTHMLTHTFAFLFKSRDDHFAEVIA